MLIHCAEWSFDRANINIVYLNHKRTKCGNIVPLICIRGPAHAQHKRARQTQGNYKPGPGHPPGRKNNNTLALEEAAGKAMANIDDAFDGDAHAFLQTVYRDPNMPIEVRITAAGRALRVEKPVLSAAHSRVDVSVDFGVKLEAARERARTALCASEMRSRPNTLLEAK